ncbi:MAG: type IV pilin-like G/H family protein [Rivularia sp. (in: cyanobacteria)]
MPDYFFKIIPQPNNTKSVMHIAQPKKSSFEDNPNLKNFIAVIYLIGNADDGRVMNLICKTTQSLSEPPKMPKPPKKFEDLKCPLGFEFSGGDSTPWQQ